MASFRSTFCQNRYVGNTLQSLCYDSILATTIFVVIKGERSVKFTVTVDFAWGLFDHEGILPDHDEGRQVIDL